MKRNIIIVISVLIVGIIGFWVVRQLSFGSLSIITNDQQGEVTLQQTGGQQKPKKIGTGDTSVRLSPGDYTVEINHDNKVTRGATTVVRGEESALNLQIKDLKNQEEVASYTALSLYATEKSLSFLNAPQKLLFKLPSDTEEADILSETYPVSQVYHWYNSDDAFFQTSEGTYYVRTNGADKSINITGDPESPTVDTLDLNAKGEMVYIAKGALYYRPSVTASSLQIATIKDAGGAPSLALSNAGTVLVSFEPDEPDDSAENTSNTSMAFTINVSTKKKRQLDTLISHGQWSPDAKRFAGTTSRGLELFSATGASLGLVSSLINSTTNTVTWLNTSEFIYADGNTVWRYTTIDGVSTKLAQIDGSIARNNPFAVTGKTIYYETDPKPEPGSVGTIFRISF